MLSDTQATKHTYPEIADLSWPQKLQIIKQYKLSEKRAATIFNCNTRTLKNMSTTHQPDESFDVAPYAEVAIMQRRGRKSSKIQEAYNLVTDQPQKLSDFCTTHGVSINTITQCGRFNRSDVKISTINGERMIYLANSPLVKSQTESTTTSVTETVVEPTPA